MAYDLKTVASKNAAESASAYKKSQKATAEVPQSDQTPTAGKNIPIVVGAVKLTGDVIWVHTFKNKQNECRAHVAVCFGRNTFARPLGLMSLSSGGNYIYRRSGGEVVDPPSAVRFYDGTQTSADPKISSIEGASKTPAFKGCIYAVLEDVLLGDFSAEFSDNSDAISVATPVECSSELAGITMVKDFESGWYYGIQNPMTHYSYFVRSRDGCTIFDRTRITFEPNVIAFNDSGPVVTSFFVAYGNVFPVRCTEALVMPGYVGSRQVLVSPYHELTHYLMTIRNPSSPVLENTNDDMELREHWPDYQTYEYERGLWPDEPYADYIESYPIPGSASQFCVLRKFVADGSYLNSVKAPAFESDSADGNITGTILDFNKNTAYLLINGGPEGESKEGNMALGTGADNGYSLELNIGWGVSEFPVVDEVIYCRGADTYVVLAAVKQDGDDIIVYRIHHHITGIQVVSTAVLSEIVVPLNFTGIEYDSRSDITLISAQPGDSPLVSSRIYQVTSAGSVSYTNTDAPLVRIVNRRYAKSVDGATVLSNDDGSRLLTYDSETDTTTEIYNGTAPTSDPIVDMARKTFTVPTVSGYTTYTVDQIEPGEILLTDLITDLCAYKGYDSSEISFQGLDGLTVRGLLISSTVRMSDLLNRLGTLFSFTFVETDGKLKFLKKRTGGVLSVDVYLDADDLARSGGDTDGWLRTTERASANNLLGGMDLEFVDPAKNYENSTIKIRRPAAMFDTGASSRVETLSVPVTLQAADAYSLMYESFYTMLQRQTRVAFSVPSWKARIEPGDCISLDVGGVVTTGVAVRVTTTEAFSQEIELEVYQAGGETQIQPPAAPAVIQSPQTVGWYIPLEIPFIRANDYVDASTSIRYHGITTSGIATWAWADLYQSPNRYNFQKVLEFPRSPMTVGKLTESVGAPSLDFATDSANSITISVIAGDASDLSSVTYVEQMNGANLCALGYHGNWELISFQTVTENSDGTLTLSGLQRGLYGTHVLYPADGVLVHDEGEVLVYLDPTKIFPTQKRSADYGMFDTFAVLPSNGDLSRSVAGPFEFQNVAMRQFQPANLRAVHSAGGTTLVVTWDETTAIPGSWPDSGASSVMHAPTTYELGIDTSAGYFSFTVSGGEYVWADYGAEIGASTNAEVEIEEITLTPYVTGIGTGYTAVGRVIQL